MTSRSNGSATADTMQPQFGCSDEPQYECKLLSVFVCLLFQIQNSVINCKVLSFDCLFLLTVLTHINNPSTIHVLTQISVYLPTLTGK